MATVGEASPYELLAPFYDLGWSGFAERYAAFLEKALEPCGLERARVLDLGCGTGSLALVLARAGHEVHGLDASEAMIRLARAKAEEAGARVAFSVQRLEDFTAQGPFDLVTCTFNTLNYLLAPDTVRSVFVRVERALSPEGCFVFDTNTDCLYRRHHHGTWEHRFPGVTITHELEFDTGTGMASTVLRFDGGGVERHTQRCYGLEEVTALLAAAGLRIEHAAANLEGRPYDEDAERLICVARKRRDSPEA